MVAERMAAKGDSLLVAAQDQTLKTKWIKLKIDHRLVDSQCRLCKSNEESVTHIISECSMQAQKTI